ncbi:rRNA maturation RNase YbeY [Oleiharenicola lentus]|uniref:Endoribonuclease YbeY n=1 Tax=Oleiharenicola lentus TaxID=2508720 RepID=A0A4V1M6T0_9BACT|nr:rRNA maturation RNase YbeY [Oleiharenicola lentus]RXK56469.1 rRNA maturation RNase YbeY [Oleiharenicola lentus]
MTREIAITNRHPRLRLDRRAIAGAITLLDSHAAKFLGGCPPGELSLVFLTDSALAQIHADFMDDPTATDVITFEGDATAGLAGEVCVSADTAWKYVGLVEGRSPHRPRSARRPTLQAAFSAELTLYVVHGWLHLAGYDDLQPAKKRRMRAAEARAMKLLHAAKAMPSFRFL